MTFSTLLELDAMCPTLSAKQPIMKRRAFARKASMATGQSLAFPMVSQRSSMVF